MALALGADPDTKGYEDERPIMEAGDNTTVVQILLYHGAHIDAVNERGQSALLTDSYDACPRVVELLIRRGTNVRLRDSGGHTALWYARCYNHAEIAAMLRRAGAKE